MKISFIIPFKNEGKYLKNCIEKILEQKVKYFFEFILINDNSTDNSLDYINKFKQNPPKNTSVKLINLSKGEFTYAYAKNIAIPEIKGEFVFMLTAHTELINKDAVNIMLKNFNNPDVAAVYPRALSAPGASTFSRLSKQNAALPYKIIRSKEYFDTNAEKKKLKNYTFLSTFCCIRTSILKNFQFHELPRSEDLEWAYRIINKGFIIIYEPGAKIYHFDEDSIEYIVHRWLCVITSVFLIVEKRAPTKLNLIISSAKSFIPFMIKVVILEPNKLQKIKYFFTAAYAKYIFFKNIFFKYNQYSVWYKKYNSSIRNY